jgi:hypothetical protein
MKNQSKRLLWLVGTLLLSMPILATAAEINDVRFADRVNLDRTELTLRGVAVLKWALLFDIYAGAFYLPEEQSGKAWTDDVPKRLELSYFRKIAAADFAKSSDQLLRRDLSTEEYRALAARLQTFYNLFRDVTPGDRYSLTYLPGHGTELRLNDQPLGSVPGADFAVAYFSLWLGQQPIDDDFRDRLLSID